MKSSQNFDLVGGIARVVLRLASTPLPELGVELDSENDTYFEVCLEVGSASYVERQFLEAGQYRVTHTLSFQCEHALSPFTIAEMQRVLSEGVVADVTLSTGALIRIGVGFPLRLQSVEFASGESAVAYPLQSWVWSSTDRVTLI